MAKKFSTNNPPGDKIKKRRFIEVSVAFLLVVLGLALYLTFSNRWEKTVPEPQLYMIQELEEAVNNYRLENFERAEMLLNGVLENAKNRPAKSKAALYLGNIYYKRTQYAKAALYYQDALFYQKNNTYAAYNRALTLLELGDLQRAERYARDVYKRRPDFQPNITLLGNIYYAEGKYREAVSLYAKGDGGDELSLFNQAQAHLQLGQVEQASGLFQRIINNKSSELVIRGLSLAALSNLAQKGRVEATIDYLEMASDIFPSSLPLRYNLSLLFFKRRRFSDAATQLKQIVTGSDSEDLRFLYGSAMFHSAKYREALQYYESVYEKRSDSTTASIIGDFYLRLGDPKGAAIFYEKALENPENETALINLVRIYMQEGDYLKAAELCHDFVDRSAANPTPDLCLAEVFYGTEKDREAGESLENALAKSGDQLHYLGRVAKLYLKYGYYSNALRLYHRMLSIDSSFSEAYTGIAEVYYRSGHEDKAKSTIVKAKNNIEDDNIAYDLGLFHALLEKGQTAFAMYDDLIDQYPYRYEAYFNKALFSIRTGRFESAVETVRKCLNRDLEIDDTLTSDLYTILGVAYRSSGNIQEAVKAFRAARALDDESELPLLNLKVISSYE